MTIGTNIPGMYDYTQQKQKKQPGPFTPTGPTAPVPTTPTTPGPQQPPMGGYVNAKANTMLQPAAPATPSWQPYRPTPTAPVAQTPAVQAPAVQAPAAQVAAPQPAYTPPVTAAPPTIPQAGPTPQAGAQGSTLQDPGSITDAGKAYAARVTQNLQGNNPLVQNAQGTEDTAAARRAYLSRKDTQESLAQTPFTPGSAQYQRAMDESRAGVNAANQAGQAGVNQVARQATADNMNAASNLEDQQYGRAVGERTNAQLQASQLANQIQDPKAKYAFQRAVAAGADPLQAFQSIVGDTGTINAQYRGQSPVETVRQDATDWIKNTTSLQEGSPEFAQAVTQRMKDLDATKNAPVAEAKSTAEQKAIEEKIRSGGKLTEEEQKTAIAKGTIPEFTPSNLGGYQDQKVADLIGKPINIAGKVYTVVQGSRTRTGAGTFTNQERHTDWTEIRDQDGKSWYVYGGKLNEKAPKSVSNDISPFGF